MASAPRSLRRTAFAGFLLLLPGCSPDAGRPPEPPAKVAQPAPQTLPAPPPPLGRREILDAAALAAASYAAGEDYPAAAAELGGRRFTLRLPFGCQGPPQASAPLRYRYDAERRTLQLSARPESWENWARPLVGTEKTEAIEGFWLSRPWLLSENCPVAVAVGTAPSGEGAAPPVAWASPETLGLAQVFEAGGSRVLRRGGRAYEVTLRSEEGRAPGPQGFRLVLQGRIAPGPEPVRCRSDSPDQRPSCLVRVEFDRVAFEEPDGKTLADWRA